MQRHTVGARGNATSFPMPWDRILSALHELEDKGGDASSIELPHAGDELSQWVQVLLKTSGTEEESDKEKQGRIKTFLDENSSKDYDQEASEMFKFALFFVSSNGVKE